MCAKVTICFPLLSDWCCVALASWLLFGLLPPSCWLALCDLWQSGANGTEPGFVSVVLWLVRCRLIGLLTPLSVSLAPSHLLPLDEVSVGVRWPVSASAVDQHPHAPTHLSSPPPYFHSARGSRLQAGGGADSPSDKATKPCLTFRPVHPSYSPGPSSHMLDFSHFPLTSSLSWRYCGPGPGCEAGRGPCMWNCVN